MAALLEVKNLSIEFFDHELPEHVVKDFDLILNSGDRIGIVGEYIGKTLEKIASSNDKIIIHMCIGDNLVLQLINVRVEGCTSTNVSYVMINTANTKIKQIEETYMSTTMTMSNSIALPNYHPSNQILDYSEKFTSMNTRTEILNFYKMNKPNMVPTINVNRYLIG